MTRSAGVAPPMARILGACLRAALRAAGLGRVGAGDDEHRRDVEGREELGVEREAGLGVEDDAEGLARVVDPSGRAVSSGSSARAVPMPTAIASDSARQRWTRARLSLAGDPGAVAGRGRGVAVERHRQLQGDQRQAGAGVLAEGLVEAARRGGLGAGGEGDLDAGVAEDARAAPGGLLARVLGGDHDAADPGREDRLDAGRLAAVVGARLQRHVHRRPGRVLAPLLRRRRAPPALHADRRARRGTPPR